MVATIMLQGHVFHSFAQPELHDSGPYVMSQFVGGIAPATFLFLTGITLAFLLHGMDRRQAARKDRLIAALRRAAYLGILAFAFRIQLYLFGIPYSSVTDLLRVDILNCMALGIVTLSGLALLNTRQRVQGGVVAGVLIAALSPLVSLIPAGSVPALVHAYFAPSYNYFAYFPWAAFMAFGISAGSILRLVKDDQMNRVMQWAAILGFGLVMSGQYFSNLPYSLYPAVEFWLNSPGLVFIKSGVILVILALTFLWTQHGAGQGWSWVRQLGTTSLLVYWVHIELVYGQWFGYWKQSLTMTQCTVASVTLILLMIALSYASTNWKLPPLRLGSVFSPEPRRVSGD